MKTLNAIVRSFSCGLLLMTAVAKAAPTAVDTIRTNAGTAQIPTLNLELTPQESAALDAIPFRFFSSVELKRRFHPIIKALQFDQQLGSPLPFDPGKSAYEHRQAMRRYLNNSCDRQLQTLQVTDKGLVKKGDAALLIEMRDLSSRLLRSNNDAAQATIAKPLADKLTAKVRAQLVAASAAMKVPNPTTVFGDVEKIDAFGGEHFRIKFKNMRAEVTLPMILSFVTGKDAAFIRTAECSANRLKMLNSIPANKAFIFGFQGGKLTETLKGKVRDGLQANRMMARLNLQQLLVVADTLMQMGAKGIMTPADFATREKQMIAATVASKDVARIVQNTAELEFLQFQQRELSDFRDWLFSSRKMAAQARVN